MLAYLRGLGNLMHIQRRRWGMYPPHPILLPFVGAQKIERKLFVWSCNLTVALLSDRCLCVWKLCAPVPPRARECCWMPATGSHSGFSGLGCRTQCRGAGYREQEHDKKKRNGENDWCRYQPSYRKLQGWGSWRLGEIEGAQLKWLKVWEVYMAVL